MKKFVLDNRMELIDPILIFFTNYTCRECKAGASEMVKLAKMAKDEPKVGRADCTYDFEPCDLFVNHIKSANQTYPYILMLDRHKSFVYTGRINATEIYENFVKAKRYMEYPVHGGKSFTTRRVINDGK